MSGDGQVVKGKLKNKKKVSWVLCDKNKDAVLCMLQGISLGHCRDR